MFQKKWNYRVKIGRTFRSFSVSVNLAVIALSLIIPASLQGQTEIPKATSPGLQRKPVVHRRVPNTPVLNVSRINDPNTRNVLALHDRGDAVIRAAILLDRLKFSPGEISADFSKNLEEAVRTFQTADQLTADR